MAQIRNKQVLYDSLIQFQSALQIKGGAAGTASDDFIIKSQLDAVENLINSLEWQNSVLSVLLDPGALSPSTGDRYLINGVGIGAWAGQDNNIAEWDGAAWVYTTPTPGTFVGADNETDRLYCFGGASWAPKYFEASTASTGLTAVGFDIQLADQNQNGIDVTSGTISVDALDGTITVAAGGISVGTITSAKVSDFATAAETAVFTAANFVDGTTIDFTVTAGDSVTAEVKTDSIDETHLKGLDNGGAGTSGQVVVSDGAGGFTYAADAGSKTEKRAVSASAVTTGNASLSVTDVFGADDPSAKTIPQVFVNGQLVKVTEDLAGSCFFGTSPAAAVAFASLAGTENLYWNGTIEGYDLDASDEVIVHYSVD